MRSVETAVIGGGPAGAATACGLAMSGRDVVLLERASAPHHKVCGEFLSVEAQTWLRRLGVDAAALGAVPIDRVGVHSRTGAAATALPFRGFSLSRFRLDEALLQSAEKRGAEVKRGVLVVSVAPHELGWLLRSHEGEAILCRRLVVATGKRALRGTEDTRDGSLIGLKMHFMASAKTTAALDRQVELFLLGAGYAGLELVEDRIANLCLALPRGVVARLDPGLPALLEYIGAASSLLAERLDRAMPLWDKPMAVVCPAGGHFHASPSLEKTLYRVGDRLAHIPPFTGDGIAIALCSAALAVEHIRLGRSASAYLAAAHRMAAPALRLANTISALIGSRTGRTLFTGAVRQFPVLLSSIARRTRLPAPRAE